MSKISYANMKLKTKADTVIVKYEDNDIEVLQYLPFEDKYDLIMVALQKANEEDIYNPLKLDMYFHLYLIYMYTNINFTDKQREDESKLFDTLESNGIIDTVVEAIPEEEYNNLLSLMNETMERKTTYKLSVSGLIQNYIIVVIKDFFYGIKNTRGGTRIMANSVKFNVGFNVDKSALDELKTSLREVQNMANTNTDKGLEQQLKQAASAASQLEKILNQSWNSKLNQLDLSKVSQGINETYGGVSNLRQQLVATSSAGTAAFNQFASTVLNTNLQLKESSKILDDFATTFKNTVRYGISSSIFNNLSNSLRQAFDYTVKLDTSLNEIRIVSEKSADDMERFARQANEAAKSLGASTLDYTGASVIYYQQGLNDEEVAARAETTLKAANVTGQSGEDVSEQLTAIWNGYKVSAEEAELYIDKVTKVAATTASDLNELATGMSKVASAAASAGVDIDQLNATLATVISVTREAPETIGTAFRSIYARLGDLALDGEDEFGVSLGTVSGQLEELGIQILDEQGQMRDMGDIIEDTAAKWQTWTQAQRQAAAVAMAGKQQYSRLIALFDNWDMYESALTDSQTAAGALNEQQDIYMESTEAHLQKLV